MFFVPANVSDHNLKMHTLTHANIGLLGRMRLHAMQRRHFEAWLGQLADDIKRLTGNLMICNSCQLFSEDIILYGVVGCRIILW